MKLLDTCTTEELLAELRMRGVPDATAFMADADAARTERDEAVRQLTQLQLSTGLLASVAPCEPARHDWNVCLNAPLEVCLRCGDRRGVPA